MKTIKLTVFFVIAILSLSNCRQYHYYMDMAYAPSVNNQEWDEIGNRQGNMNPPIHSIARDEMPYSLGKDLKDYETADKELISPLDAKDPQILIKGKKKFDIYCSVCHGLKGKGDGPIKPKMVLIPALYGSDARANKISKYGTGRLYHIITRGYNSMSSYASQIQVRDRWYVAHYVKFLQQTQN